VSRRGKSFWLALPAVALCGACLSEVGAKCNDDSNCPSGQYCAAGSCAVGSRGDAGSSDAGIDGGIDAGPSAPLSGTVTLNGGLPEPATNTAWVFAWDHPPLVSDDDGGTSLENPQLVTQTLDGGGYAFWDAGLGTSYYLAVEYNLNGDGVIYQAGDSYDLFVTAHQAGVPGSNSVTLDTQTSGCIVWSLFDGDDSMTSIVALIADIPSVITSDELPSSSVTSAEATDPNSQNYGLTQVTGTGISQLDGKYAYDPSIGTAPTAPPGTYSFAIDAMGYPHGTCAVEHQPLTTAPVITSVASPWVSTSANSVSWSSAPGTEFDTLERDTVNSDGSEGPQQYQKSNVTSPASIPAGKCPVTSRCRVIVISTHTETQGLRAGSIAAAGTSDIVTGT
jgi:hypothetical protein